MAKTTHVVGIVSLSSPDAEYLPICGGSNGETVEARTQVTWRTAGVFSDMKVNISSNTVDATSTYALRKNGANGNCLVSVTPSGTGIFEDTTNTDTASTGDEFNYLCTPNGAAGDITGYAISISFAASSGTVQRLMCAVLTNSTVATNFAPIEGRGEATQATEVDVQFLFRTSGTLRNGFVYIVSNSKSTTSTFVTRKDGADGNITMSVLTTATGVFEDTVNTDTVTAGEKWNWSCATGSILNTISTRVLSAEFSTTDSSCELITGNASATGFEFNASSTSFLVPGTQIRSDITTESYSQLKAPYAFSASNLSIFIVTNAGTSAGTFDLRVNGSSSLLTIPITALTTGWFENTSTTVAIAQDDLYSFRLVTGAVGTTLVGNVGMKSGIVVPSSSGVGQNQNMLLLGVG